VDNRSSVADPIGMAGRHLELEARIVIAKRAAVARVVEVCKLAGVEVSRVVRRGAAGAGTDYCSS
jgi:cell division ATPase FtsA